jgi:DNA-binding response OmpR family regulator
MKKILLVEDTRHLSEEIADVLKLEGFQVITAMNALKALEVLPASTPDLVITDLQMPWMDGFEFIRLVRALPSFQTLPIIILSANGSSENRERGMAAGANAFLLKPCKLTEMVATIRALLN